MIELNQMKDMDKAAQDRLWDDLSEEKKGEYRMVYKKSIDQINTTGIPTFNRAKAEARYAMLYDMFGEHNLNPAPQIKTWEDVEKDGYYVGINVNTELKRIDMFANDVSLKIQNKIQATLKIAKLIDLGYGGMVSEEEWRDGHLRVYTILPTEFEGEFEIANTNFPYRAFLSFHTQQQAEEFISHESNKILVRQYYLM